jgi:hypothetical protein
MPENNLPKRSWPVFNPLNPVITAVLITRFFDIQNSTFCPTDCIYMLCVDLRTNSDYFSTKH